MVVAVVDADGTATTRRTSERSSFAAIGRYGRKPSGVRCGCLDRLLERARDIQRESPWIVRNPPPGPYFLDDTDRVLRERALDAFKRFSNSDRARAKALEKLVRSGLALNLRRLAEL